MKSFRTMGKRTLTKDEAKTYVAPANLATGGNGVSDLTGVAGCSHDKDVENCVVTSIDEVDTKDTINKYLVANAIISGISKRVFCNPDHVVAFGNADSYVIAVSCSSNE